MRVLSSGDLLYLVIFAFLLYLLLIVENVKIYSNTQRKKKGES